MALNKQNVSISFEKGLDTKTDSKQVLPGKMLLLENATFLSVKRFDKRNGYAELPSIGSQGSALAAYKDELVAFDGINVSSYSEALGSFTSKGQAVSLEINSKFVVSNGYQQSSMDSAYHPAGLKSFCWEDTRGGTRYSVLDATTNQPLVSDAVLDASGQRPKAFALGNYLIFIYYNGTNLVYKRAVINNPGTLSAATTLSSAVDPVNTCFDAGMCGTTRVYYAWNNSIGACSVAYLDSNLVVSSDYQEVGEDPTTCISVWCSSNQIIYVAYYNGTKVRCFAVTYALLSETVAFDVETVANVRNITGAVTAVASATNETSKLFYEISAATTYNHLVRDCVLEKVSTVITPGTPEVFMRSVGLASKVFTYNDVSYLTLAYESTLQPTYFLSTTDKLLVGKIATSTGAGLTAKSVLPEVSLISDSEFMLALGKKEPLSVESGVTFSQEGLIEADISFLSQNTYLRATLAENLHFTGGFLSMYDGVSVVEHGFHLYPEQGTLTAGANGAGIDAGTYQYCFVYEWKDNLGQTHMSAPSIPQTLVLGVNKVNVSVVIPTLRLTAKRTSYGRTDVIIGVYRTTSLGQTFYKVTSITSPTFNDPTADTVTFVDAVTNTNLVGNQLLYTTGDVLENIAPPAVSLICNYKNRIVYVPSENKNNFGFSKEVIQGVPVEFSDFFVKPVNPFGGDITGLAQMDDKLIIFKRNIIMLTAGDGPNDTGTQDDFAKPQVITTDAGCINPRSIGITPLGIIFKSEKGIYLLDRSLNCSYIGVDVDAYNDLTITSTILVPNTNQIRFATAEGQCIVYDYLFQQWSIFTNILAADATVFQNLFTYLSPTGTPWQETPGLYLDGTAFIKMKAVTGWLSFAGLQGYQRVYQMLLLGEYKSLHRLILTVAYDFNENASQQTYINPGDLLATPNYGDDAFYGDTTPYGGSYPLYQFRLFMERQKCQAIQIGIEEVQDENYGEGLSLSAITFVVGAKRGTNKLPASRSFG